MSRITRPLILAVVTASLLLAGCATVTQKTAQEALGGGTGGGEAPDELSQAEALTTFRSSLSQLKSEEGEFQPPDRFSMDISFSGAEEASGEMSVFMDAEESLVIFQMIAQGLEGTEEGTGGEMAMMMPGVSEEGVDLLFAVHWKTGLFGTSDALIATYDEDAEPATSWEDLQQEQDEVQAGVPAGGEEEDDVFTDPGQLLATLEEIPEDAEITYEETTYNGDQAIELTLTGTNGTQSIDATAILLPAGTLPGQADPLPVHIELSFEDPEAEDPIERQGELIYTFAYGDQADHRLVEPIKRLASMAYVSEDGQSGAAGAFLGSGGQGEAEPRTWTIQPAKQPGLVALGEAELRVHAGQSQTPLLTLPLEEGSAENDQARIVYDDADASGTVTPGDTFTLTPLGDQTESLSITFYDEESDMALTPGLPLLAVLGLLGLAGGILRRRG